MSHRGQTAVVFTDGACKNNGLPNAKAGFGVYWGEGHQNNRSGSVPGDQNGNRAELYAAYIAIQTAVDQGYSVINICSDSTYVRDAVGNACQDLNSDLLVVFLIWKSIITINVQKVAGHDGIRRNEKAHQLATQGANH